MIEAAQQALESAKAEAATNDPAAAATVDAAAKRLAAATTAAKPRDIVDIIVSQPITIRVKPAETK